MKLIHTADWHLGKMIYGRSLLPDQEAFLRGVFLPLLERERPDFVVLAGDVFDRPVAPAEAIRLFDFYLAEAVRLGVKTAVISGNHDGPDRMALCAPLLRQGGVFFSTTLADALHPVPLSDGADLYLLPYFEPAAARAFLAREDIRGFHEAYAAVLEKLRETFDPSKRHLLAAHCFVMGGAVSASESPTFVGGSSEVPPALLEGFDYVALGHLHAPQRAGTNGRYAGSPLKYSFDEAGHKKSVTRVEVPPAHGAELLIEQVAVQPERDMRVLRGLFEDVLKEAAQAPSADYLFLELMDEGPVFMPADRLRPYYPNLLGIQSLWLGRAGSAENGELREQLLRRRTDDTAVLDAFMKQICGTEADGGDRALFLQAVGEGGAEK